MSCATDESSTSPPKSSKSLDDYCTAKTDDQPGSYILPAEIASFEMIEYDSQRSNVSQSRSADQAPANLKEQRHHGNSTTFTLAAEKGWSDPGGDQCEDDKSASNSNKNAIVEVPSMRTDDTFRERFRMEFEDLLDKDERGEPIDEDRLYFLVLYARRTVGEQLDKYEMEDLEVFENQQRYLDIQESKMKGDNPRHFDTKEHYTRGHDSARNLGSTSASDAFRISDEDSKRERHLETRTSQVQEDATFGHDSTRELATDKKQNAGTESTSFDGNSLSILSHQNQKELIELSRMKIANDSGNDIDAPCRFDKQKLFARQELRQLGPILQRVDASLDRLEECGTTLHAIRKYLDPSEWNVYQRSSKPTRIISDSELLLGKDLYSQNRQNNSDPGLLIAHAGTKGFRRKENLRVGNDELNVDVAISKPRDRLRQKERRTPISNGPHATAAKNADRKFRNSEYICKAEQAKGASSRRSKPSQNNNKHTNGIGNAARNRRIRQKLKQSQEKSSAYRDRRKLAHIPIKRNTTKAEHKTNVLPEDEGGKVPSSPSVSPNSSGRESNSLESTSNSGDTTHESSTSSGQPSAEKVPINNNEGSNARSSEQDPDQLPHQLSKQRVSSLSSNNAGPGAFGWSQSISVLQEMGGKLSTKHKTIHSSIRNEGFLMATDLAYERIVKGNRRLELLLSLAEWRHAHVLMLYARIFRCELAARKIDQPKEFSIYLPNNLQILEPLGVVLASIGIVEDLEGGLTYIPVAKPLRGRVYEPHDPNDVTIFMEWSQYKWNASWTQVKFERQQRKSEAQRCRIDIPERTISNENHQAKLGCWENMALEMWLGWDEELWFSYKLFVESANRSFLFVDFPKCTTGTYAWLIPSQKKGSESYAWVPSPSIANAVWMIALLFNLSDLHPESTHSWFCKTETIEDLEVALHQFLDSAANVE